MAAQKKIMRALDTLKRVTAKANWQSVANIATAIAVIVALSVFVWEVRASRQERQWAMFSHLLQAYADIVDRRQGNWVLLKDAIKTNPATKREIQDRTSSLDYLQLRSSQSEPLYAIEHIVLELEIRSLNILNEACNYAKADPRKEFLLGSLYGSEIFFYQERLDDILRLRSAEIARHAFSVPHHQALTLYDVGDYYGRQ